jgi:hypothetical protein
MIAAWAASHWLVIDRQIEAIGPNAAVRLAFNLGWYGREYG